MRVLLVGIALFWFGCAHYSYGTVGPDPRPRGEAPRREPVTRAGLNNPLNETYGHLAPLHTYHGKASYYHDSLAGNLTANGEIYSLDRLTAAHLELPFCTIVRVVRKDTGHTVILRVNDRGPYGNRGRILDLSHASAEALGMIEKGVAPIRAEILEWGDGCTFHHRHF